MLNSLRQIVQEVNAASSLQAALDIIVGRVRDVMGTEACSVYMLDSATKRYVFAATEGLNKRQRGRLSLAPKEGLVGQVAAREEPLNLENAPAHPAFHFFPKIGE
ncbi:MAG TPA: GAF domain-containing protein, partial [Armatimonadetes bacterium]|nr:GAF domain-containing protein [Armatimonadota bacterium]